MSILKQAQFIRDKIRNVYNNACISELTEKALKIIAKDIEDKSAHGNHACSYSTYTESYDEIFVWRCFERNIENYSRLISENVCDNITKELKDNGYELSIYQVTTNWDCYRIGWDK